MDPVTDVVTATNTVTFGVEPCGVGQGPAFIAEKDDPVTAFEPDDEIPAGASGGSFFLTDEKSGPPVTVELNYCISFATPVNNLSVDLYDYRGDGGEKVGDTATLTVFDAGGSPVGFDTFTITAGLPNPNLETLSIQSPFGLISSAELSFDGTHLGTGIDNITFTTNVPSTGGSGGPAEPPTIGMNMAGTELIVTCGVAFDGKCFTITALFHEEFKLYEMMSGTHTISITMYCASGVSTCNYAAIGVMPYSESMDNTTWKIELYKDFEGNLTTVTTDPEEFLGTVTVTTQILDDKFWVVSFTIEFKNKDTGPMMFGVQARDGYNAVRNWYLNEGVEFIDSDAYPSILTEFKKSLEVDSLCLDEDPTYRYSCAFAKIRERATQNAEETLRQIMNN